MGQGPLHGRARVRGEGAAHRQLLTLLGHDHALISVGPEPQPWAARMGVTEPELDVRDLGNRWGSYRPPQAGAGAKGLMSLGWPLFQLPMHLIDYVIAHELAHVKVSGHREDFWRLLRTALPEYEERRADLDELGRRLWMGDVR
uniref:M48 metallopeptidase family protein n=1 Tax=Streptomyces sp. CHD11 TaxID=2741325 RepID=UPI0027E4E61B|nr:M48 family metallopeptidase [Streptomyces sp. CHD11]